MRLTFTTQAAQTLHAVQKNAGDFGAFFGAVCFVENEHRTDDVFGLRGVDRDVAEPLNDGAFLLGNELFHWGLQ